MSQSKNYLFDRLPEIYRKIDFLEGDNTLKRYLDALDEGGFRYINLDIEKLYNILSIEKAPQELIPIIGNMLGYKYVNEVDDRTQRKIVENLVELYKRKGTKSAINFIIREFTEYDTKLIQTEYRVFKTWSPNPQGIPVDEYVEPRTLGSTPSFHPNPNTCYLLSEEGKYNASNIIIYIVDDADENSLVALNNILREFMPVGCRFSIQGIKVNKYVDECTLQVNDDIEALRYIYRESTTLRASETFSKHKLKVKAVSEEYDFNVDDEDLMNPHERDEYRVALGIVEDMTFSMNYPTIENLTLRTQEKYVFNMNKKSRAEQTGLSATTEETLVIKLFDEENLYFDCFDSMPDESLPIIGTDSISEEV